MKFNTWKIVVLIGFSFFQCKKEVVEPFGPKELPLVWSKQVVVPTDFVACFRLLTVTDKFVIAICTQWYEIQARLCAFDKHDGTLMWEVPGFYEGLGIQYMRDCTVLIGNTLYYLDLDYSSNHKATLFAVDLSSGTILAQQSFGLNDMASLSLSTLNDQIVLWLFATRNGQSVAALMGFDHTLQTMDTLFTFPNDPQLNMMMGPPKRWITPTGHTNWVISQRANYTGAFDGKNNRYRYFLYNESLDTLAWTTTVYQKYNTWKYGGPLLSDRYLIEQTNSSVHCIDLKSGSLIWNQENGTYPSFQNAGIIGYNNWIVAPSAYAEFGLLEPNSGTMLWEVVEPEFPVNAWQPTNEALFVLSNYHLVGYAWTDGEVLSQQRCMPSYGPIAHWEVDVNAGILHDPIENRIYIASCEGEMLCYQVE